MQQMITKDLPFTCPARRLCIVSILYILSACSTTLQRPDDVKIVAEEPMQLGTRPLPGTLLSEDILYKILLAEIAGQKNQFHTSVETYLDLAFATRDLQLIKRATHIAVYVQDDLVATKLARLWLEVAPDDLDARQMLAMLAAKKNDTEKVLEHLNIILTKNGHELSLEKQLWIVVELLNHEHGRKEARLILQQIMADHQDDPATLFIYAQILIHLAELSEARVTLEKIYILQPENENVAITYARLLNRMGQAEEAIAWVEERLKQHGEQLDLQILHARILTDLGQFDKARQQFEMLLKKHPADPNVLFSLGMLYIHANQFDDATNNFLTLTENIEYINDAHYYLARIAEEKDELDTAYDWYQGVGYGNNYFDAQTRIALLLSKQEKLQEALAHLDSIQGQNQQEQNILIQMKANILSAAGNHQEAMDIYNKALQGHYDSELLYARAMLAEKMDDLAILENDLRSIIVTEPKNSQALNALGYTLADRTNRYDEAYSLIKRAIEISPDDHHIIDSMGWVLYRQGQLDKAIEFLNRAWEKKNDPEIAAHLGEVLWIKGDKKAARMLWNSALQIAPNDEKLKQVIQQFEQ